VVRSCGDARQLWAKLMRQEVDLALFIEREDYEVLKDDPAFKAYVLPIDYYYAVVYNPDDPILADRSVREAVAHSIDRESLIKQIAFGYGVECNSPFYPGSIGFNSQVKPFEFNLKKAEALLREAGWSDSDKDGILEKGSEQLEIRVLIDSRNQVYHRMGMLLRQQLQEAGIKLVLHLYNNESQLTDDFLEQNKLSGQLRLLLAGVDPDEIGIDWYKQTTGRVDNLWAYKNPEVERYFSLGRTTQNKGKKEWIYKEIHSFIYKDQPALFLYYPFHFHVISSKFRYADELFTLSMPFYTLKDWSMREEYIKGKGGDRGWRLSDMGQR
ncbi:MAG: ABC transporter substrate-binding protein, partial [Clostridia bacterium]